MSSKTPSNNEGRRKTDPNKQFRPKLKPNQQNNSNVPMKKYSHSAILTLDSNNNRFKLPVEFGQIRAPKSERLARKPYNTNCSGTGNSSTLFGGDDHDEGLSLLAATTLTDAEEDDNDGEDAKMLRNPQAQGRSQSFRHRPVQRMVPNATPAGAVTARSTFGTVTADTSQERRRSTPTITRRCSLQNRSRVEPRIDAWPEPKQRSEAEERFLALPDACDYTRVRQFNIDAKGAVIARGDSFRRKRQQQVVHAQRSNPIATVGACGGDGDASANTERQSPVAELAERSASAGAPLQSAVMSSTRSAASSVSSGGGGVATLAKTATSVVTDDAATPLEGVAARMVAAGKDNGITRQSLHSPQSLSSPAAAEAASGGASRDTDETASTSSTLRICVLGQSGSGKSSLIRRFSSSDYRNVFSDELLDDTNGETQQQNYSVSVNIGGHECDLSFTECDDLQMEADKDNNNKQRTNFHAYLLVYSIDRKASFRVALRALEELRETHCPAPIILVGNKMDLERRRTVMENEVKSVMLTYDVPHFQISVALNHDVDDLLVGIVAQIKEAFQMQITVSNGGGENIRPASRASKDGIDSDFHAAIRRFSRRKKRQMGLGEADMDNTGKCTNLFAKLRRWRRGTANL